MKFAELYRNNQVAVKRMLESWWCANAHGSIQEQYSEQLKELIDKELFAPQNVMPLVQCMDRYESVTDETRDTAEALVTTKKGKNLWKKSIGDKNYPPYKHQQKAWEALLENNHSMVVTTGTGSGKTECFMLPLVKDLIDCEKPEEIQAIFLYPLNALMEDQKERLQTLLRDSCLSFAVYNGNLPTDYPEDKDSPEYKRIEDEKGRYSNILPTRRKLRETPPNILLTNPTMLEYMLLRNKDQHLFSQGSLRWIVIDETHTFTGAGATELAMLIRRVLDAFGQDASSVRFATSSATIGDGGNDDLKKFIADITGADINTIEAIDGKRQSKEYDPNDTEKETCRNELRKNDYIPLDKLIEGKTIEERLEKLDEMCEGEAPLKAKVHFFYRVANNGLRVNLNDHKDGVWNLKSFIPVETGSNPYLELYRCEHCGEYFALGETVPGSSKKFQALSKSSSDMFDFDSDADDKSRIIFALSDHEIDSASKDGDIEYIINGDEYESSGNSRPAGWRVVANLQNKCPHCHTLLFGKSNQNNDSDNEDTTELEKHASAFRVQAPLVSRVLAPSILEQMRKSEDDGKPHNGQQYISFVDSRQAAARSTLQQNIEEERLWVYSRLYHELLKRRSEHTDNEKEIKELEDKLDKAYANKQYKEMEQLSSKLNSLKKGNAPYMDWKEIHEFLDRQKESEDLCYQFINKSEDSNELNEGGKIDSTAKNKYLQAVMIEQLGKRPRTAAAPETMRLFTSFYPKLEDLTDIPDAVKEFNRKFLEGKKEIDLQEWKNLLKIFMDTNVRSNEAIYLRKDDFLPNLDIMACQRFGTQKQRRRSVKKPQINKDRQSPRYSNIILLLAQIISPDTADSATLRNVVYQNQAELNKVLDAFWNDLVVTTNLVQPGYLRKGDQWVRDNENDEPIYRLNVFDIAFKLYDRAWLCDTRSLGKLLPVMRPVDTLFMGYSPYIIDGKPTKPEREAEENWKPLKFAARIDNVKSYPDIFIQAEHTAQVDKIISKQSQDSFKNQKLNILACSTTMEMGVDLGNLELVMMSSIPPHPANYKQRAGRSGRNDDTRSACITLCGSDAVGIRTMNNPLKELIQRPMATPFVDLRSRQVIQRHVNAFLLRLSGLLNADDNSNNLGLMVCDFFTPYKMVKHDNAGFYKLVYEGNDVYPTGLLKKNDNDETLYDGFLKFLTDNETNPQRIDGKGRLDLLVHNTCLQDDVFAAVEKCKDDIRRCRKDLQEIVEDINEAYRQEMEDAKKDARKRSKVSGDMVNTGYGYVLRHKYIDTLVKNLLQFFATSRFTPNANMPVNIIEFDKKMKRRQDHDYNFRKSNNPSYPLHEAIAQYAPGNTVVLENRTYVVRGLQYTGMYRKTYTFKKLFSNGNITQIAIDGKHLTPAPVLWPINGKKDLTLIEPTSFIPDINENATRVVDRSPYTQVSAQLIGVDEYWTDFSSKNSLISMRNNEDCMNAQILYYNEGRGYGYQFCSKCGKTIMESYIATSSLKGLEEMHNEEETKADGTKKSFHYMINRLNEKKRAKCPSGNIFRNVIIGGLIQTDYCEIKIRKNSTASWLQSRDDANKKLLTTLGILMADVFTDYIGKERRDIDFVVMPNGHLCIFDTNPGGSGYSNQLSDKLTMQNVLKKSLDVLENATSKDALLDQWTIRYLELIDVDAAKEWLQQAIGSIDCVPDEIKKVFKNDVLPSSMTDIVKAFQTSVPGIEKSLFVNSDFDNWLYNDDTADRRLGWKQRMQEIRQIDTKIQLNILGHDYINLPCMHSLRVISDWASVYRCDNPLSDELMPLALLGNTLYFTANPNCALLNNNWAKDCVYCTEMNELSFDSQPVELKEVPIDTKKIVLDNKAPEKISSNQLFEVVNDKISDLTQRFWEYCNSQNGDVKVTYQDEHLKSVTAMITTLQFIEQIMKPIGKNFSLTFLTEEYEESDNYRNISSNIYNWMDRNEEFRSLLKKWRDKVRRCVNDDNIKTQKSRSLPHWRELRIECGGKALSIYPNGGFINEWFLDEYKMNKEHRILTKDNVTIDSEIPLFRRKEIMYDAEIKDI